MSHSPFIIKKGKQVSLLTGPAPTTFSCYAVCSADLNSKPVFHKVQRLDKWHVNVAYKLQVVSVAFYSCSPFFLQLTAASYF